MKNIFSTKNGFFVMTSLLFGTATDAECMPSRSKHTFYNNGSYIFEPEAQTRAMPI